MPIVYSRKRLRAQNPQLNLPSSDKSHSQIEHPPNPADPPTRQKPRKRRRFQQLYIDAGQSKLSHTLCRHCNLLYAPGTCDEALHRARHSRVTDTFPWPLHNCTVLPNTSVSEGAFAAITSNDCHDAALIRRLRRLDSFVCSQLASNDACQGAMSVDNRLKLSLRRDDQHIWIVIVYVKDGLARGFVHAEKVRLANTANVSDDGVAEVVRSKAHRICRRTMCGVRKIWVHHNYRKKGIASVLTDLARIHLLYAGVVARDHVAFTPPTTAGALFARKYVNLGDHRILVYQLDKSGRPLEEQRSLAPSSAPC